MFYGYFCTYFLIFSTALCDCKEALWHSWYIVSHNAKAWHGWIRYLWTSLVYTVLSFCWYSPIFVCPSFTIFSSALSVFWGFWWLAWLGFGLKFWGRKTRKVKNKFQDQIDAFKILQTNLQTLEESRIRSVMVIFYSGLQYEFRQHSFVCLHSKDKSVRKFVIVQRFTWPTRRHDPTR